MNNNIFVIDSFPGSGKTSWAIQKINKYDSSVNILFITPFLKEVERIIESCPDKDFYQPEAQKGHGSKMNHLVSMIYQHKNICSTHALLQNINEELIEALTVNNYVLFLDEAFQVLEAYDLYPEKKNLSEDERKELISQDVDWLQKDGYININPDYSVTWNENKMVPNKYAEFKKAIDNNLIYMVRDSLFLWAFPHHLFMDNIFQEVYVLTYMWESQYQYYYYKYFNIEYQKYHMNKIGDQYKIVRTESNDFDIEWRKQIKEKITVYDNPKLNKIGDVYTDMRKHTYKTALSLSWYQNASPNKLLIMKNNIDNYFRNVTKSKPEKRLWCCFKEFQRKLRSKGAAPKYWLEVTSRATNEWRDRDTLVYAVNRYPNVFYQDFFSQKGIELNLDEYAVSDLIQWIWRSAIRDNNPITIYLPSVRMRVLLDKFLNNEEIVF
jgi:hypothetical protein